MSSSFLPVYFRPLCEFLQGITIILPVVRAFSWVLVALGLPLLAHTFQTHLTNGGHKVKGLPGYCVRLSRLIHSSSTGLTISSFFQPSKATISFYL